MSRHSVAWLTPGRCWARDRVRGVAAAGSRPKEHTRGVRQWSALRRLVVGEPRAGESLSGRGVESVQHGHYVSFNGMTRLLSAMWPFLTLGYLIILARQAGGTPTARVKGRQQR